MVILDYEKNKTGTKIISIFSNGKNQKISVYYKINKHHTNNNINIFIKTSVFHSFCIPMLIQYKTQVKYYFYKECPHHITNGPWYNTTTFTRLRGYNFEYFFLTACKDRSDLICAINAHNNTQNPFSDSLISGGGRTLSKYSTINVPKYLSTTINSIES